MTQNEIRQQESTRTWAILICVLLLTGTIGYLTYDVGSVMLRDTSFMATRKIEALGTTHFRFREIYRGPSMEAHHQNGAMVSSASAYHSPAISGGHAAASYSGPATGGYTSYGGSSAGTIPTIHSSMALHSYGGGSSAGGGSSTGSGRSSSAGGSIGGGGGAVASFGAPTIAFNRPRKEAAEEQSTDYVASSGPRRVYTGQPDRGDGYYWDEDEEDFKPIPTPGERHEVGETKWEGGIEYTWNGSEWVRSGSEVGTPIGDTPILLLLLLASGYICYRRKQSVEA